MADVNWKQILCMCVDFLSKDMYHKRDIGAMIVNTWQTLVITRKRKSGKKRGGLGTKLGVITVFKFSL